ncbi:adenylate/guanylate cyclase domain-containing protein [archaeon]|nr:adenylate/guanylate cyclase domain-containing protein [archaeon]MBT3451238.1 adenylate/guanylate cyclase domain-containing protein [archaeon]MBT6869033.1 adenylate/guanylate cyclase domain-containing protein [archaeon]MBT7193621.1 adenylate/guanylate cyclase domain-containing protein [archaeon]MBT7380154.1 adenylate/guanylate cyclase domain-containing protein [archaeon]
MTAKKRSNGTKTLAVMFVDMVDYTKNTSEISSETLHELHDDYDNLSIPVFQSFEGRVIKKIGDAFLITFENPSDAVYCGIELQRTFQDYNKKFKPKKPIKIRVAIHLGEVSFRAGDVYGDTVNTASRLESVASAGQVIFSGAVYSAMEKEDIPVMHLGLRNLKGLKYPIQIFRVRTKRDEWVKRKIYLHKMKNKLNAMVLFIILFSFLVVFSVLAVYYLAFLAFV